ncbi:MAG TPA: VCBS repeat-containing protein, partial [Chthonomonas sp.]
MTHRFTRRSCLLSLLGALSGCMPPIPSQKNAFHTSSINPLFRDVAAEAGLDYRWVIPGPRPLNILQTIGNGCAFLDFDNDGNLDILLVGPTLALFHNDGKGHFQNVTQQTGLD